MIPFFAAELLIALNFEFKPLILYTNAIVGISALLIAYLVYYCINRVIGLRFLNFTNHVESKHTFSFIDDFKIILEQLSCATTSKELMQLSSTFFRHAFDIPVRKVTLHLRQPNNKDLLKSNEIDAFLETWDPNHKILIYDELAFSNFYEEEITREKLISFLQSINADIFLPIFEKERIIGFIIVQSNSRPKQLYTNIERDEMLIFGSYLSNIINLLQHRNLDTLIIQEKELKEELYKKNQEITQYKESIRSFITNPKHKAIGIVFYKHRRFIYANQTAKEMINININTHEGHPLTRAFKHIARQVEEYKSPQMLMVKDPNGDRFIISGVSNIEQNNVILIISYPDIADVITKQLSLLKDPSKWDYLLYLETTKPGQLVNQLIPGNGQTLLNFKISLLQTALSKKATLLEMPTQDLIPLVELLHHVSMRETLQTLTLQKSDNPFDVATKLFGINALFGTPSSQKPLLEKLDENGTLFIQNIENLDWELQEYLADFLQYGYYRVFKSEHKVASSVRIICSTHHQLYDLVEAGSFCKALFNELKKCSISMPSLLELSDIELNDLAQGYAEQAIKTHDLKNLLELTEKERVKLIGNRPVSLQELKIKIQQLLIQKSKKNNIEQEIQFEPAYEINDPELIQASRLGKHALRDHKIMVMLWNKFKNQNKIATFLGVNRSSVNRRCKEYNLDA
jgi:transcriptional regulator with PAS, ATPase and Fis domain